MTTSIGSPFDSIERKPTPGKPASAAVDKQAQNRRVADLTRIGV
jgi:hypothetical protein